MSAAGAGAGRAGARHDDERIPTATNAAPLIQSAGGMLRSRHSPSGPVCLYKGGGLGASHSACAHRNPDTDTSMQGGEGAVARRGLARGRRTRLFSLAELAAAATATAAARAHHPSTVYVELDAAGYVVGARGEGAARVALAARAAPPPPARAAARPLLDPSTGALYLELATDVPPHHDLTVWPPLHLLLLPPPPTPILSLPDYTGVDAGGDVEVEAVEVEVERGHRCGYCGRRYSRRYGLRIHERTHTGARPLRCPHCARAFADPSNLNKHVRLHLRDAPRPRPRPPRPRPRDRLGPGVE